MVKKKEKKEKRCNKHVILIRMVKQRTNDFYEKEQSEFENTQDITGKVSSKHQSINQLSLNSIVSNFSSVNVSQ